MVSICSSSASNPCCEHSYDAVIAGSLLGVCNRRDQRQDCVSNLVLQISISKCTNVSLVWHQSWNENVPASRDEPSKGLR